MSAPGGYRITVEFDDYEEAWAAYMSLHGRGARSYYFAALKADGEPQITDADFAWATEAE